MSNDLNQYQCIGRLGKDPESRFMPNGTQVTSFSVAVGSQWKDKAGDKQEATEWVSVTAFDKLAEICDKYLVKGSQVYVSGRMKTDKYTDKQGVEKYSTKIVAERMQMLGGKQDEGGKREGGKQEAPKPAAGASGFDDLENDIPF